MSGSPQQRPGSGALAAPRRIVRELAGVVYRTGDKLAAYSGHHLAASMSYRILFSVVPLLILVVSVFSVFMQDEELRTDLIAEVSGVIPLTEEGTDDLEQILSGSPRRSAWSAC